MRLALLAVLVLVGCARQEHVIVGVDAKELAAPVRVDACCKHCGSSQPCGDSCISPRKTCKTAGGCACY